ncbi:MAG: ClC family H(+)/Cl(-) exchange transporter [Prevotellaceae bacterium]|nr:ClC family H(+)/Cl(-) exchange transporter [Prevotellaceae bacterium]
MGLRLKEIPGLKLYCICLAVGLFTGLIDVPYHFLIQKSSVIREHILTSNSNWHEHLLLILAIWCIFLVVSRIIKSFPLVGGGGITQTRAIVYGRIVYKNSAIQLIAKFISGTIAIGTGLSLGKEGASIQMGSYIGDIASKTTGTKAADRNHIIAAGAGAGLAAAFSAPLSASIFIIESIERFEKAKTTIAVLLASIVAGLMSYISFSINNFTIITATQPRLSVLESAAVYISFAIFISLFGKCYHWTLISLKRQYPKIKMPVSIKLLSVACITYLFCIFAVEITGGGQNYLLAEATNGDVSLSGIVTMLTLHFLFTAISFSLGFPGGIFLPMLVTGGLAGKIFAILLIQLGISDPSCIGYFVLIGMSSFFIAIVRTPVTAMVLITEITGQFDILLATVIIGTLTYFITHFFNMTPFYTILYSDFINQTEYKQQGRISIHLTVMAGSYFDGKRVNEISLPNNCEIIAAYRFDGILDPKGNYRLKDGDQLEIELDAADVEKLHEPLNGLATVY